MAYAPPSPTAVSFQLLPGYSPPGPDQVSFALGGGGGGAVTRRLYCAVGLRAGAATARSSRPQAADWLGGRALDHAVAGAYQVARGRGRSSVATYGGSVARDRLTGTCWSATLLRRQVAPLLSYWSMPPAVDAARNAAWRAARHVLQRTGVSPWGEVYTRDRVADQSWTIAARPPVIIDPPPYAVGDGAYVPPPAEAIDMALLDGYTAPAGPIDFVLSAGVVIIDPPAYVQSRRDPAQLNPWGDSRRQDAVERLRWGHGPRRGPTDPPPVDIPHGGSTEPPPIPIARRVYLVLNDVSVVRLPERTPIEVASVDLDASVDAWCWSVSMELADPSQINLLKPDSSGPKLVEITLNTYVWTAIIEARDRSREFAGRGVTVTGRSQTALLASDYTAQRSLAVTDPRSAQQLANIEISDRALPFTVDWQGLDWLVPAGAWYYQDLAPIDVIAQIAAARGGVLQSHPSDPQLLVRARYPTSPWAWSAAAADVALPIAWATGERAQQQSKPLYDAVVVAGQAQGVLARVTRQGSAAETWAPQVVDQLIVTADVARERGRNVLADRGLQERIDYDIPLFPPGDITAGMSGLYQPLLLVDVQDPDDPWQGQSLGVSIRASRSGDQDKALEIWQTVSLERHLSDAS